MNIDTCVSVKDGVVKARRRGFPSEYAAAGDARGRTQQILPADRQAKNRRSKVQAIRWRLKHGRYDIDAHLIAVVDKIFNDLLT